MKVIEKALTVLHFSHYSISSFTKALRKKILETTFGGFIV